jgi:hypothetical protein
MKKGLLLSVLMLLALQTANAQSSTSSAPELSASAAPAPSPRSSPKTSPKSSATPTPNPATAANPSNSTAATPSPSPAPSSDPTTTTTPAPAKAAASAAKSANAKGGIALPPEKTQPVRLVKFEKPPVIDGKLDDEVWKQASVLKDFYQVQPGDNIAPSKQTEVLIGFDAKFLYLAYHAYDEPGKVRATVAKRDSIFDDDYVGLFFDTFNDQRKAYEMNFNPLGIQADGILTEGRGEDFSVDLVVESKGMLTADGYTVEVAIPFKSLRYEAGKGKLWGIHFYRRIKRLNNELDMWMPISRDISSWLSQAGHLSGLEGISTERTLEIIPSLTLQETGRRARSYAPLPPGILDQGRMVNQPLGFDPGLTVKYGITPTVTLDFTYNPDFAQVEADQTVVTANQRFPIFFEEKRPFFLEGIDIFRTQISAVHTRAIVDPDFAAKLTGKRGRNTFGLLVASDNGPGNFTGDERLDPRNFHYLNNNALVGILRLKHDIGADSNIGFLATSYNFKSKDDDLTAFDLSVNDPCSAEKRHERTNQLAGFDGRFRLNKTTTFDAQVLGSTSHRCFFDADAGGNIFRVGNGAAYAFDLNDDGRHFGYEFSGVGRTQDFRSDVGFSRRTNTNNYNLFMRYNSEPNPKATLISWRIFTSPYTNFDWQGRIQNWGDNTQLRLTLPKQGYFGIGVEGGYERLFEAEFGPKRLPATPGHDARPGQFAGDDNERSAYYKDIYAYGGITPSKKYSLSLLAIRTWGAFDLDFGGGPKYPRASPGALLDPDAAQDPGAGNQWHIESSITYQPTSALRASLDFTKERLVRHDTGRVAYDDNIASFRATYQFTRFTFARARVDYDTLAANVRGQFLLGWAPNPGTSFYVGYNDDLSRNGYNPFTNDLEPGFRRNGRTFFIKMSYLFRKSF